MNQLVKVFGILLVSQLCFADGDAGFDVKKFKRTPNQVNELAKTNANQMGPCRNLDVQNFMTGNTAVKKTYRAASGLHTYTVFKNAKGEIQNEMLLDRQDIKDGQLLTTPLGWVKTYFVNPKVVAKALSNVVSYDLCVDIGADGVIDVYEPQAYQMIRKDKSEFNFDMLRFIEYLNFANGYWASAIYVTPEKMTMKNLRLGLMINGGRAADVDTEVKEFIAQ